MGVNQDTRDRQHVPFDSLIFGYVDSEGLTGCCKEVVPYSHTVFIYC